MRANPMSSATRNSTEPQRQDRKAATVQGDAEGCGRVVAGEGLAAGVRKDLMDLVALKWTSLAVGGGTGKTEQKGRAEPRGDGKNRPDGAFAQPKQAQHGQGQEHHGDRVLRGCLHQGVECGVARQVVDVFEQVVVHERSRCHAGGPGSRSATTAPSLGAYLTTKPRRHPVASEGGSVRCR